MGISEGKTPIKEGGCNVKGLQKYFQRKKPKEEQERENCNSGLRIRVFWFLSNSLYLGKTVDISINSFINYLFFLIICLDLPLWKSYLVFLIN